MTERLAEISDRINGIRQLGSVVNAMRGIAAARVQQARSQLVAVDSYAATIAGAIGRAMALRPPSRTAPVPHSDARRTSRLAIVLFCAEQGFAGAFSERVLDAVGADLTTANLFLVGTRGIAAIGQRGITPGWTGAMPAHAPGIPKLADVITEALYTSIATGDIERLDAVYAEFQPGRGSQVRRRPLFPIDRTAFPQPRGENPPLLNLSPATLITDLTADYLHAELCQAALHAFAAENQARMEAMAAARNQIERQLAELQATERMVRQEEITAEIIELAAGEEASRAA